MKAIDTNILVRFLMNDDENQAKKVLALFKRAERNKDELLVSMLVVLETLWVLASVYKIKRAEILKAFSDLLLLPMLKFESQAVLQEFIRIAAENQYDLSDLLIAYSAKGQGAETVMTFDKKASHFALFELVR